MKPLLVVVSGPTAAGKTDVSVQIAKTLSCPVISSDSRQFYKEMQIGTARPAEAELKGVPHFFLGHLSVTQYYNVSRFEQDVIRLFTEGIITGPVALMTGGSGLYTDAVCRGIDDIPDPDPGLRMRLIQEYEENGPGYFHETLKAADPKTYKSIDLKNKNRLIRAVETLQLTGKTLGEIRQQRFSERPFRVLKMAINLPREELYDRINRRVEKMMEQGLEEEAKQLLPLRNANALNTVGYKELFACFDGKMTREEAVEKIKASTRQYARRQITWLRRDKEYHWFHPAEVNSMLQLINQSV